MKIGILTLHNCSNDGSLMQAYCLQRIIGSEFPDSSVEIINIFPAAHEDSLVTMLRSIVSHPKQILTLREKIARLFSYRNFRKKNLNITMAGVCTDDSNAAIEAIRREKFDAIFVGSDTVWELRSKYSGVPDAPNFYFLPGLENCIKIAFAASADPVPEQIPQDIRVAHLRELISDFSFISTRDDATRNLLVQLGIGEDSLKFMPDPTLLMDFRNLARNPSLTPKDRRIAGIAIRDFKIRKAATEAAKRKGFYTANLLGREKSSDWSLSGFLSLEERVGNVANFDLLITDRFHTSIFTLKLNDFSTPVLFIEDDTKWDSGNSKGRDLFRRLGLEDFVHRTNHDDLGDLGIDDVFERWNLRKDEAITRYDELREHGIRSLRDLRDIIKNLKKR